MIFASFYVFMAFRIEFLLGIAVFAPRARYSFATAQKSTQKRPPRQLRPKKQGANLTSTVIMLRQNSQKTLRHAGTESP